MAFGLFKKKAVCADRIFMNGKIYTMDQNLPWTEAVAVKDGRIMACGNFSEMSELIDDDTETVDLDGKYMFPGFIDIHHSPVMKMMETSYPSDEAEEEEGEGIEYVVYDEEDEADEADETEEITEEEDLTEYYVDTSEFTETVSGTLDDLADHGITMSVNLRTPNEIENEYENSLIELYTEEDLKQRFMGALYVNRPVPARLVKEVLTVRRTKCVELGDMIRNEILHLVLDSEEGRPFPQKDLNDIMIECSDRGFILFIEAVTHEDLIKAYKAVDAVRNRGYHNNILIISDEELTAEEDSQLSSSGSVYLTWRTDELGISYFEGCIDDPEEAVEHLTMESAAILGMEDDLGSIERGKYADFTVFRENILEMDPGKFSRLFSDMTVVNGVIVHDVETENEEFLLDMMIHNK